MIPALVIGHLTNTYILPRADSPAEIYAVIGFAILLSALGSWYMIRLVGDIRRLLQQATAAGGLHHVFDPCDNELAGLSRAIAAMAESLDDQMQQLEQRTLELRRLNEQLGAAHGQLRQVNQLQCELVVLATRELRTQLDLILKAVELLLSGRFGSTSEKQMHLLDIVRRASYQTGRLLHDLLGLARSGLSTHSRAPTELNLGSLMHDICTRNTELLARRGICLELKRLDDNPVVRGYAEETALALDCILSAAIQAAAPDSVLNIQLQDCAECALIKLTVPLPAPAEQRFAQLAAALDSAEIRVREWNGLESIELPLGKEFLQQFGGRMRLEHDPSGSLVCLVAFPKEPLPASAAVACAA